MGSNVEHLFMYLLAMYMSLLVKYLLKCFSAMFLLAENVFLLIGLFAFVLLSCKGSSVLFCFKS